METFVLQMNFVKSVLLQLQVMLQATFSNIKKWREYYKQHETVSFSRFLRKQFCNVIWSYFQDNPQISPQRFQCFLSVFIYV